MFSVSIMELSAFISSPTKKTYVLLLLFLLLEKLTNHVTLILLWFGLILGYKHIIFVLII